MEVISSGICEVYMNEYINDLQKNLETISIETERLVLRHFIETDADCLMAIFKDEHTMYMDGDTPFSEKNKEFERRIQFIKDNMWKWFFLEKKDTGEFVGCIHIREVSDRKVNTISFGCSLVPTYQHCGYGYEAFSALIKYLKEYTDTSMLLMSAWEKNEASIGLIKKLGFHNEGKIHRNHCDPMSGEISDSLRFYLDIR